MLDLLSNTAYMGTDEEGLPLPSYREGDGGYHIAGTLTTAPPTTLRKTLDNCVELGKKLLNSRFILVCPTPRYGVTLWESAVTIRVTSKILAALTMLTISPSSRTSIGVSWGGGG